MEQTLFHISQMDCPSEENLIRMKLQEYSAVKHIDFAIPERQITVFHEGHLTDIEQALAELNLGSQTVSTSTTTQDAFAKEDTTVQKRTLWIVLTINLLFFFIEVIFGIISQSMGLVADSLDMLADGFVYAISLLAVGGSMQRKKQVARVAGIAQILLAGFGFMEVLRRFFFAETFPDALTMVTVSVFALIGNAVCLYVLQQSRSDEAHMQASMIFTSNDVLINTGVICSGGLVYWLGSALPDLIIGSIVFLLVLYGAMRILRLSK